MLAKCSNPDCSAQFLHLKNGRLFVVDSSSALLRDNKPATREYFWLCRNCSSTMTLRLERDGAIVAVSMPKPPHIIRNGFDLIVLDKKTLPNPEKL